MTAPAVVVGGSIAGVRTAEALRAEAPQLPIVLLSDESIEPYDKPPLSKQYLSGAVDFEAVRLLTRARADDLRVDLRLGARAIGIDPVARVVRTDGGDVGYSSLVIATGASARPSPWRSASGVHVLRSVADAERLRSALRPRSRVVVVGGGFIGAEVATTALGRGCDVIVVDPLVCPMARTLGDMAGAIVSSVHERHGVQTRFGAGVERVTNASGGLMVTLTDGEVLGADVVVVGIGASPNDDWLVGSGLTIDDGVLCDEFCRAEGAEDVYAAGDVARWKHPALGPMRLEHWTNAVEQAAVVAHNIAHPDDLRPHRPVPYVWSDQYGWKIQAVGAPRLADAERLIGTTEGNLPRFVALQSRSGRLVGAVAVNWSKALSQCRRAIASVMPVGQVAAEIQAGRTPIPGDLRVQ